MKNEAKISKIITDVTHWLMDFRININSKCGGNALLKIIMQMLPMVDLLDRKNVVVTHISFHEIQL